MKSILGIAIVWAIDELADVSHLETTAQSHYGENGANWAHVSEEEKTAVIQMYGSIFAACEEYAQQDAARLAAFHAGDWHVRGCYAKAQVVVNGVCQTIRSAGLWGIESDCSDEYAREVEEEEREALFSILQSLGFDVKEQKAA